MPHSRSAGASHHQRPERGSSPGMTARVDGLLESRKNILKIPLSAVFEEGGKEIAYAADGKEKAKPRKIAASIGKATSRSNGALVTCKARSRA